MELQDLNTDNNYPLVSICCLVYNHEAYLKEALDGFLMQKTTFPFEIVIHDDASKDNSASIIREYTAKYPNIFRPLYQTENQKSKVKSGMNPRFNFPRAKGKYIALCDGDDYWTDPNKLQMQVDFLEVNDEFIGCFHNVNFVDERKNYEVKKWRKYDYKQTVFTQVDTIRIYSLFHTSSYVFRNQINSLPNWFKKIFSGDMALLALLSEKGKLKLLDGVMSVYRKNDGGVTSNEKILTHHKRRIILNKCLNKHFNYAYNKKALDVISYHQNQLKQLKKVSLKNKLKRLFKR